MARSQAPPVSPSGFSDGLDGILSVLAKFAEGRVWAVGAFAALSAAAILCAVLRAATDVAPLHHAASAQQRKEFNAFQRSYMIVYVLVMLADWLQGTHMYTLYSTYAETNASVSVGFLFFSGFLAAGVLGTFTGPLVDRYGRKRACLVYVVLEVVINCLEHLNAMHWLLAGRVLGGVSTSLLFSAFEAWMVTEHRRRRFPEQWIERTFALCAVCNGVTAIAAGFLAQVAADALGDIGPFECAIALTVAAGLCMLSWRENYGGGDGDSKTDSKIDSKIDGRIDGQNGKAEVAPANGVESQKPESQGLSAAWSAVRGSEALVAIGAVYALFEGAMYIFVFNWVPSLARSLGGFGELAPVQGLLFACLMAAISIGGELFSLASRACSVETVGVGIFGLASGCMALTAYCELCSCGSQPVAFNLRFASFLGFEVCVGAFQPCIATLRSKYVPDAMQSTINNLFRLPLNLLVAAGTVLSDVVPPAAVFAICAAAHAVATAAQLRLAFKAAKASDAKKTQ